jgi:SAM-dependent methyltransferase
MIARSLVAGVMLAGIVAVPLAWAQSPGTHEHSFHDADKWARVFDDPQRDAWQKPHEVIQALKLDPNAAVADIGAGTGYFSSRLARMLPAGRVYAVDTEPDMVKHLRERAKRENLQNIIVVPAQPDNPKLPGKVDLALFVDVYHHVANRERYLRTLGESLKPDGRVAIVDFRMDAPTGPPKSARVAPDRVKSEFRSAGYDLVQEHAFLPNQYFLVFRRAKR